jgi:hypothetical protein
LDHLILSVMSLANGVESWQELAGFYEPKTNWTVYAGLFEPGKMLACFIDKANGEQVCMNLAK